MGAGLDPDARLGARNGEVRSRPRKTNEPPSPTKTLPATFDAGEPVPTPRYDRAGLGPGSALEGPAIVDDAWSTVVVPPGATLTADDAGHLHIATGAGAMSGAVDPITLEVIRHALTATAEEMSLVVMRSARSPLLREAGDLSSALTDADGHLIAQGRDIPMHMGVMSFTVREFLKRVPRERLEPGDVWFLNLPEVGGNHLPDVKAIRPIFVDGSIVAFAASLAHWADIGGAVPGSYVAGATDAWQEGLRIPPFRLFTAAGPDREKLDMVCANVRGADEREGDILAQVAASRAAEERVHHICAEHGTDTVLAPSPRSTTGPRRRCGRRSQRSPTAPTKARTGSTTMPAAADRSPSACASPSRATAPASTSPGPTTRRGGR